MLFPMNSPVWVVVHFAQCVSSQRVAIFGIHRHVLRIRNARNTDPDLRIQCGTASTPTKCEYTMCVYRVWHMWNVFRICGWMRNLRRETMDSSVYENMIIVWKMIVPIFQRMGGLSYTLSPICAHLPRRPASR